MPDFQRNIQKIDVFNHFLWGNRKYKGVEHLLNAIVDLDVKLNVVGNEVRNWKV
jgi:hypothetical protein